MRKPPRHPCPACGRARHRFRSGDLAVLCKLCWYGVSDDVRAAYNAAGRAYLKNRRAELGNMRAALTAPIEAAKALRDQPSLAFGAAS